jgi:hypothetical protein
MDTPRLSGGVISTPLQPGGPEKTMGKKKDRANTSPFSPLAAEKQKRMLAVIQSGKKNASAIATEFGVSRNTVAYHADRLGAKLPKGEVKAPKKRAARKAA